jgi:hypothetical protein
MKWPSIVCGIILVLSPSAFPQTSTGGQTTNGPCSPIFNGSGNTNNCTPPSRHISADFSKSGAEFLSAYPAKIQIIYPSTDAEAYNYAMEITSMLKAAGWEVVGPDGGMFANEGAPLFGVELDYKGDAIAQPQKVTADLNTSWGRLSRVLTRIQGGTDSYVHPNSNLKENELYLWVYPNPKAKPQ